MHTDSEEIERVKRLYPPANAPAPSAARKIFPQILPDENIESYGETGVGPLRPHVEYEKYDGCKSQAEWFCDLWTADDTTVRIARVTHWYDAEMYPALAKNNPTVCWRCETRTGPLDIVIRATLDEALDDLLASVASRSAD